MLCVLILYITGGIYSLKSTPNDRFEKLFMAILFALRVVARNLLRGNRRRKTFHISFWCLAWDSNPGFSSNKPTHYLLDHDDYRIYMAFFYFFIFVITYDVADVWSIVTSRKVEKCSADAPLRKGKFLIITMVDFILNCALKINLKSIRGDILLQLTA